MIFVIILINILFLSQVFFVERFSQTLNINFVHLVSLFPFRKEQETSTAAREQNNLSNPALNCVCSVLFFFLLFQSDQTGQKTHSEVSEMHHIHLPLPFMMAII